MGEPTTLDGSGPNLNQTGELPIPALRTTPAPLVDDRPDWVARHLGRDLTEAERTLVSLVCDAMMTGPWNLQWKSLDGDDRYASVSVRDNQLATYDFDALTRLVILAHDRCYRLALSQSAPRRIRIEIWRRRGRNGDFTQRHATIEEAIASVRRYHPLPEIAEVPRG